MKKRIIWLLFLMCLIYFQEINQAKAFDDVLNQAENLFNAGNITLSKKIVGNYLVSYPEDQDALKLMGKIYIAGKEFNKAIEALTKALKLNPTDSDTKMMLGRAHYLQSNFDLAKRLFLDLLQAQPKDRDILKYLGDISFNTANYDAAVTYYLGSYNISADNETTFKLAKSYELNEMIEKAEEFFKKLTEIQSSQAAGLIGLGRIETQKGNYKKALEYFNKALSYDPENVEAKVGIISIETAKGNSFKAITMLQILPKEDNVNTALALAYSNIGRSDTALELLKNIETPESKKLKESIKDELKPIIEPVFAFSTESGNINKIMFQRYGSNVYVSPLPNYRANFGIIATPYQSGGGVATVTATEYSLGLTGKPTNRLEFDSQLNINHYSNDEAIVLGNILLNCSINDTFSFKTGYLRNKIEDSILSVSGLTPITGPFANQLVGRVADNKYLFNLSANFPNNSETYFGYNLGYVRGVNVPANPYNEITFGMTNETYESKKESFINKLETGYNIFFTSYKQDRSGFGGANLGFTPLGSDGTSPVPTPGNPGIGGYFSPNFMLINRILLNLYGSMPKIKLEYFMGGYLGVQNIRGANAISSEQFNRRVHFYWEGNAALIYNAAGKVSLRIDYNINNYETTVQHNFISRLVIKL